MGQLIIKFGKRLKYLRKEAGLTQEKLADKINISLDSVSNIERGIQNPKLDTLEKIAKAFNIKLKDLFDFND
ncbi:MAG: helix-turn-helix domain-containing protein [gamma proteobacterium symbiont of Taylorina sp.]|nr:helix-turn-helix domain-containing protein [gamma proteobacterium symbiont of Taylorina sp.]